MISLGIFGTFWGVFIALYPLDFSPEKVNDSIEALLHGMKTAFVTSLLGLGASIVTKGYWSRAGSAQKSPSPEHEDIAGRLEAIRKAIAGDDDSSLVTQMQKMLLVNREGFDKLDGLANTIRDTLVANLENLTNEIRDSIGKQLGESIRKLIDNIEEALINQFGETFVQFNEAVQALKKWQEDHRSQVEQLTTAFSETAQGIERIKNDCETIPQTMESLAGMVKASNEQLDELSERLRAFSDMKQQAVDAFPTIKANLDKIGEDLSSSAKGFEGLEEIIKGVLESNKTEMEKLAENMRGIMEQAQRDAAEKTNAVIAKAGEEFSTRINEEIDRLTRKWGNNMVAIAERCRDVVQAVDENNRTQ